MHRVARLAMRRGSSAMRTAGAVVAVVIVAATVTSCANRSGQPVSSQPVSSQTVSSQTVSRQTGSQSSTERALPESSSVRPSPRPRPVRSLPSVGPLFWNGSGSKHVCNAAVVDSPQGDVLLTAAHCISGSGAGIVFAPGYDNGLTPYGTWVVQAVYAASGWLASGDDASSDYAFLVVKPRPGQSQPSLESVVGGNHISLAPAPGQQITLVAYAAGDNDDPIICTGNVYRTKGYPSIDCPGYPNGTSGGPWLTRYDSDAGTGTITALIGGLHAGGCTADTSYSSPFTPAIFDLLARAEAGGPADTLPSAGPSGC